MSKKSGFGKFIFGTIIGAVIGVLFAPKKGSETRKELKAKIDELISRIKESDIDDIKSSIEEKLEDIKEELETLDKEKVLKIAKKKAIELEDKVEELIELVLQKGTPVLQKVAKEVKNKVLEASEEIIARFEKKD